MSGPEDFPGITRSQLSLQGISLAAGGRQAVSHYAVLFASVLILEVSMSSWQTCPLEAITAVVGREPAFLGSKQQEAGHAALSVGLGRLTVAEAGAFASLARQAFEAEVMLAVGELMEPYVRRLIPPQCHTQGTSQSVWTLCLLDTPAATLATQAKLDTGYAQVEVGRPTAGAADFRGSCRSAS